MNSCDELFDFVGDSQDVLGQIAPTRLFVDEFVAWLNQNPSDVATKLISIGCGVGSLEFCLIERDVDVCCIDRLVVLQHNFLSFLNDDTKLATIRRSNLQLAVVTDNEPIPMKLFSSLDASEKKLMFLLCFANMKEEIWKAYVEQISLLAKRGKRVSLLIIEDEISCDPSADELRSMLLVNDSSAAAAALFREVPIESAVKQPLSCHGVQCNMVLFESSSS